MPFDLDIFTTIQYANSSLIINFFNCALPRLPNVRLNEVQCVHENTIEGSFKRSNI